MRLHINPDFGNVIRRQGIVEGCRACPSLEPGTTVDLERDRRRISLFSTDSGARLRALVTHHEDATP
jgi:hypothetical protein